MAITELIINISPPIVGVELFSRWVSGASSKMGWVAFDFAHDMNFGITAIVIKNERKKAIIALKVI
jgi:hypothetical protein